MQTPASHHRRQRVEEGFLPKPRKWHTRKVWLVAEVATAMSEWPEDGIPKQREDAI
jgi:hypothetical protein